MTEITGVDSDQARSLLDAANGNLDYAIDLHFDSQDALDPLREEVRRTFPAPSVRGLSAAANTSASSSSRAAAGGLEELHASCKTTTTTRRAEHRAPWQRSRHDDEGDMDLTSDNDNDAALPPPGRAAIDLTSDNDNDAALHAGATSGGSVLDGGGGRASSLLAAENVHLRGGGQEEAPVDMSEASPLGKLEPPRPLPLTPPPYPTSLPHLPNPIFCQMFWLKRPHSLPQASRSSRIRATSSGDR